MLRGERRDRDAALPLRDSGLGDVNERGERTLRESEKLPGKSDPAPCHDSSLGGGHADKLLLSPIAVKAKFHGRNYTAYIGLYPQVEEAPIVSNVARHPVAEMIEAKLVTLGKKQAWLGQRVADIEGRANPYSQPSVNGWLDTIEDKRPGLIFNIEKALEMKPGHLSRHLGYLPLDSKPVRTIDELLEAEGVSVDVRDVIRSAIATARKGGR